MGNSAPEIKLIKCNCGDKNCDYYGFSDGRFPQGSGWDKKTAEAHLRKIQAHDVLLAIAEDYHRKMQNDSDRAAIGAVIIKARGEA